MLAGILALIIIVFIFKQIDNNQKKPINQKPIENDKKPLLSDDMFDRRNYVMTQTELYFFRELKKVTDKLELCIFPQVNLERIITAKYNDQINRNRIKSRTIDYTIVNNKNYKIVCCIELDDYTHNYSKRIERDTFINKLFDSVGIKLHRINVSNNYNLEELESKIKESL